MSYSLIQKPVIVFIHTTMLYDVIQWILLPAGEYYHCLLLETARFDVLDLYSLQCAGQMNRANENRKLIYQNGRRLCNSNCYRCIYGWRRRDRWWRHHGNGGSDRLYSLVGYVTLSSITAKRNVYILHIKGEMYLSKLTKNIQILPSVDQPNQVHTVIKI